MDVKEISNAIQLAKDANIGAKNANEKVANVMRRVSAIIQKEEGFEFRLQHPSGILYLSNVMLLLYFFLIFLDVKFDYFSKSTRIRMHLIIASVYLLILFGWCFKNWPINLSAIISVVIFAAIPLLFSQLDSGLYSICDNATKKAAEIAQKEAEELCDKRNNDNNDGEEEEEQT